MGRESGTPKTGGRKKGTPNKRTAELYDSLKAQGIDVIEQLAEILPQLDINRRTVVLINMLPYLYPKRKHVELEVQPPEDPREKMTNEELDAEIRRLRAIHLHCNEEDLPTDSQLKEVIDKNYSERMKYIEMVTSVVPLRDIKKITG